MEASTKSPGAACQHVPATTALRDGLTTVAQLADRYLSEYKGRDSTRMTRISFWVTALGDMPIGEVIDDHVQHALDQLAVRKGRFYAGRDAAGQPILKAKAKAVSGPTTNRYLAAFSSLCTYAQKKRLVTRHWINPYKLVEKQPEHQGRLHFLDQGEFQRLLTASQ